MIFLDPHNHFGMESYAYWENFLTEDEVRFLAYHQSFQSPHTATVGGQSDSNGVNLNVRRTNVGWVNFSPEHQHIWHKIANAFSKVNSQFFHINITGLYEEMQLTEYSSSFEGHYGWHIDGNIADCNVPRKLSMVLMLSDPSEFEGGELQVNPGGGEVTLEMKQGRAWFFPSYVLHRVKPVTKGVRKSAVVWAGGEQWK